MNNRSPQSPKATILNHGLSPKKSFGQNFMVDQRINTVFADAVRAFGDGIPVLEIGAGTGSLTDHLLRVSPLVHAVERDRDLLPILREHFAREIGEGHLVLHEADGARFAIDSIFSSSKKGILVGNLPYHLTSTIILLALAHREELHGAIFLVQKEVADRLVASPNNKQYGFLTVILKLAFAVNKIANVDKNAFWPVPKIDSAIIKLTVADHGISQVANTKDLIIFVRAIFQKRRKKLSTILSGVIDRNAMLHIGIDPDLRPENLSPDQFLRLFLATANKV
jgi:16S rRNA (adenine1518-N6/adenine1519-N6)-dimethyltransferase